MKMTRRSEERGRASSHTSPEKLPPPLYKNRDQIQIVIHLDRHAKYMYYILHARHIKLVSKCLIEYDDIVKFFCSYDRHRIRPALKLGQFDEVSTEKYRGQNSSIERKTDSGLSGRTISVFGSIISR